MRILALNSKIQTDILNLEKSAVNIIFAGLLLISFPVFKKYFYIYYVIVYNYVIFRNYVIFYKDVGEISAAV